MDQDNQNDQEQKKQSGGFNPINTFNNLMDIRKGFGKKAATQAGEAAAKTAGKMAAQTAAKAALSNPYVLAALAAIVLLVIVFAIVMSGAAPGAPAPGEQAPSVSPIETIAPIEIPTPPLAP